MKNEDTIIALATPPGVGAISVIRISGQKSFEVVDKIFLGKMEIGSAKTHTVHYGNIVYKNDIIDDVLVSVFRNPHSYTGEDSVEISSHGSPMVVQEIIALVLSNPEVRTADPGEFTKRAFLNGKIDLAQAEAVADLINSRTITSLRGSRNQLNGLLSSKVSVMRKKMVDTSSFVELELDFAEEEIEFIKKDKLFDRIQDILADIDGLLESYSFGRVVRDGLNVAIVGEPNVGKSSILNYLLKESRAIVSSIPGTTRDTIREEISIDGFLFRLYDTAGLRIASEEVEKEGVLRSKNTVINADIVLFVGDVKTGFSSTIEAELRVLNPTVKIIRLLNKIDLGNVEMQFEDFKVSAKTGEGMILFFDGLKKVVLREGAYTEKDAIISNIRHYNCLFRAKENLTKALKTLNDNLSGEFISSDLRSAEASLAEIIGLVTPDDVLDNVFSKFCIGK